MTVRRADSREGGMQDPTHRIFRTSLGDIHLHLGPILAATIAVGSGDFERFFRTIREDVLNPDVVKLLETKGEHDGVRFSNLKNMVFECAIGDNARFVGGLPVADPSSNTLIFYTSEGGNMTSPIRNSMRRLLNQPPIEIDFERTPLADLLVRSGVITEDLVLRLRDKASWKNQEFGLFEGARSVLERLQEPIEIEHPAWGFPVRYTFGKAKGIVRKGGILQPADRQYEKPAYAGGGRVKAPDLDARGRYVELDKNNPDGGLTAAGARNEAVMCNMSFEVGTTFDICLEAGVCKDRKSQGEPMGVVTLLTPAAECLEDTFYDRFGRLMAQMEGAVDLATGRFNQEGLADLNAHGGLDLLRARFYYLFFNYGALLDRRDGTGIWNRYPHHGNILALDTGPIERLMRSRGRSIPKFPVEGYILYEKDHTKDKDIRGCTPELQVGYRALTIALAWEHFSQLPGFQRVENSVVMQDTLGINPYLSLLMGYFRDRISSPELYGHRAYSGTECEQVDGNRFRDVLHKGREIPIHTMPYPEIKLLWDKVRGVTPEQPNVPVPNFIVFDGKGAGRQNPSELMGREWDERIEKLMDFGISWISVTTSGEPIALLNRDKHMMRMRIPEGLTVERQKAMVLELVDKTIRKLSEQE